MQSNVIFNDILIFLYINDTIMICYLLKNLVCWTTISLDGRHVGVARAGRLLLSGCWTGWIVAVNFLQSLLWDALSKAGEASNTFPGRSGNMSWTLEHVLDCATCAKAQRRRNEFSSVSDPIWQYHTEVRHKPWPLRKGKNRDRGGSIRQHPNKNKSSTDLKCIHKSEICRQHVDSM